MQYVYILFSQVDKRFYVGYTADLRRRIKEHENGKVTSTKIRQRLQLVYYEAFKSKLDARRRERYLKTSKGRSTLKQMLRVSLG